MRTWFLPSHFHFLKKQSLYLVSQRYRNMSKRVDRPPILPNSGISPLRAYSTAVDSSIKPDPLSSPIVRNKRPAYGSGGADAFTMSGPSGGVPGMMGGQDPNASTSSSIGPPAKKSRTNTPWTPAEEQRLKTMRDAGNSWAEIAKVRHDCRTLSEGRSKKLRHVIVIPRQNWRQRKEALV